MSGKVLQGLNAGQSQYVKFNYDDLGQRVEKESKNENGIVRHTYYIRDASGSVMSIYEATEGAENLTQKELPIYGAGRVGIATTNHTAQITNEKYELTDHLGNVRGMVMRESTALSFTDYFPFGMAMPNKNSINNNYRYAYQGQEKDPETGKEAFELRLWDSRIGRWLTTDPKGQYSSPYLGMGNNPLNMVDEDGGKADGIFTVNQETGKVTKVSDVGDDVGEHLVLTVNNKGEVLNTKEFHTNPGDLTVSQALLNDSFYAHFLSEVNNTQAGVNLLKSHKSASFSRFMRMFYNDAADKIQQTGGVMQIVGYGLTLTVVGAEVGAPMMELGTGISIMGSTMKVPIYLSNKDYKGLTLTVTSELVGLGIGNYFAKLHKLKAIDDLSSQILGGGGALKASLIFNEFNK